MRPATILGGAFGGLLVAALLAPSLYLDIPRSMISDWTTAPRSAGLLTTLLAAVALVLSGMVGAAGTPDRQARAGAVGGTIAAMVAMLVVLPGAAVLAHGPLIELVEGGRATTESLQRAIVTSVVRTPGYQALGAFLLLAAGALLGWLGGVVHDLWRGKPSRVVPAIRPGPVAWLGLLAITMAVPAQLGSTVAVETFVFQELGAKPTWVGQAQLTAPLALGGLIAAVLVALISRDAMLVFRHGQRTRAAVWMLAMAAMLLVLAAVSVPIYWQVLILPGGIVGTLAVLAAPLVGLFLGWRSPMELETEKRIFQDVVGEGVFAGVLGGAILALHGVSSGGAMAMLSLPYGELALGGATKVSTAPLGESIHQLFLAHLTLPVFMALLAMAYLMLAVPVWFVSRLVRG
jgi:hypothetical protein